MGLGKLLIRADASIEIGTGHVMRCLALAEAWQDAGGTAIFALASSTPSLLARLSAEQFEYVCIPADAGSSEDAERTVELSRSRGVSWIVLDGYAFDSAYQENVNASGAKLLLISDAGGSQFYSADVVLNQNLNAAEDLYAARSPQTRLLLGTQFVLLRREFRTWIHCNRQIPSIAQSVLVTLGGSDPTSLTGKIMRAGSLAGLKTTFLFGGSAREPPEYQGCSDTVRLKDHRDPASIMAQSDLTVICGGGTLWESLFMGCATLSYTRNVVQEEIMRRLHRIGAVHWLGRIDDFDPQSLAGVISDIASSEVRRKAMSVAGRQIVDGRGTERVLCALA